jgi:putative transposase
MDKLFEQKRNSYMELGQIYFWTATINNWQKLLLKDEYKEVIINSFKYLTSIGKLDIFGFVIMPNHIHTIWRCNQLNGKETAQGSFLKYTSHQFKKLITNENRLNSFAVSAVNKKYEFWQRDPLAIHLFTPNVAYQKLDYLHNNPTTEYWQLADEPANYLYSSASYYELNDVKFDFLKDLRLEF